MQQSFQFCLFFLKQKLQFGWIKEETKKFTVITPQKTHFLAPASIILRWQDSYQSNQDPMDYLQNQIDSVQKIKIDLDTIYELCQPEQFYSISEIADFALTSPNDEWSQAFLYICLVEQKKLFHQKQKNFKKRSPQQIAELEKQEAKEKELALQQDLEAGWAMTLKSGNLPKIEKEQDSFWQNFKRKFLDFVLQFNKHSEKNYFINLFNLSDNLFVAENQLLIILQCLDFHWSWAELKAKQAGVCENYSTAVLEEAELLVKNSKDTSKEQGEIDQTNLLVFTVDSTKTKDFDDAISLEKTAEGLFIRLHISNLASFVPLESAIFEHLQNYISSAYTAEKVYNLLPPILSENVFSLKEKTNRSVITFEWLITNDLQIIKKTVYRSRIYVAKNLSYAELESLIQKEENWLILSQFCQKLQATRKEQGALIINRQEVSLDLTNPEKIKILAENLAQPSYQVVSELAIAANSLAGEIAANNNLTLLYRLQAPYTIINQPELGQDLQLKDVNISAGYFSLNKGEHAGLGITNYTQVTSPIRRVQDFIGQLALICFLEKRQNQITPKKLISLLSEINNKTAGYAELEKDILNYWKLEYLSQNQDKHFVVELIRKQQRKSIVSFTELQLNKAVLIDNLELAKFYSAKIEKIDLINQTLQISIVN